MTVNTLGVFHLHSPATSMKYELSFSGFKLLNHQLISSKIFTPYVVLICHNHLCLQQKAGFLYVEEAFSKSEAKYRRRVVLAVSYG